MNNMINYMAVGYVFRSNCSTLLSVMEFVENIVVDNKQLRIGVFIDLRQAFDTIHLSLLLRKCESNW